MKLIRKIAAKYLETQYRNAKKYLRNVVRNEENRDRNIEMICNRVRSAGMAYAQTEYSIFSKDGSFREDMKCTQNVGTNVICMNSLYDDFIAKMEMEIAEIIQNHRRTYELWEDKFKSCTNEYALIDASREMWNSDELTDQEKHSLDIFASKCFLDIV